MLNARVAMNGFVGQNRRYFRSDSGETVSKVNESLLEGINRIRQGRIASAGDRNRVEATMQTALNRLADEREHGCRK